MTASVSHKRKSQTHQPIQLSASLKHTEPPNGAQHASHRSLFINALKLSTIRDSGQK